MPPGELAGPRLEFLVQPGLDPAESLAVDRLLLDEVAAGRSPGALRVFDLAGEVLSLGRYHLAPDPAAESSTRLVRRLSGGRVVPAGAGFVGVTLVLPHRAALVGDEPSVLRPEQVMNRCVRGILEGLQRAGVAPFYPGRDLVTVAGRMVGLVSFEVEASGATLFEAVLASGRDFSIMAPLLDAVDPTGVVAAAMVRPDEATSLARELGRVPGTAEVAQWIQAGYAARSGVAGTPRASTGSVLPAVDTEAWLRARRPRPELDHRGTTRTELGVFESHFSVRAGRLGEVVLAGDFIASSAAVARLERELVGCPAEPGAVDAVVRRVFADAGSFILGIGPLTTIAETFARGLA